MQNVSKITVFFDGGCPLCAKEIAWLRKRTGKTGPQFVDIDAEDFSAEQYGKTLDFFHSELRALAPSGSFISGMEVFRILYSSAGFGIIARLTALPGIRQVFDLAYRVFAKNRLRLTGRCVDSQCALDQSARD